MFYLLFHWCSSGAEYSALVKPKLLSHLGEHQLVEDLVHHVVATLQVVLGPSQLGVHRDGLSQTFQISPLCLHTLHNLLPHSRHPNELCRSTPHKVIHQGSFQSLLVSKERGSPVNHGKEDVDHEAKDMAKRKVTQNTVASLYLLSLGHDPGNWLKLLLGPAWNVELRMAVDFMFHHIVL